MTVQSDTTFLVSYWRRFASWLLDYMAAYLVFLPFLPLLPSPRPNMSGFVLLVLMIYRAIADARWDGSIGRWLTSYRLLSDSGEPLPLRRLMLRNVLLWLLLQLAPLAVLGVLAPGSGLHIVHLLLALTLLPFISYRRRTLVDRVYDSYAVVIESPPSNRFGMWVYRNRQGIIVGLVMTYVLLLLAASAVYLATGSR